MQGKLAILLIGLFGAVMGFWWYSLSDHQHMIMRMQTLHDNMQAMQAHHEKSLQALEAVQHAETRMLSVAKHVEARMLELKRATEASYAAGARAADFDRLDRIVRLIEADLSRRCEGQ